MTQEYQDSISVVVDFIKANDDFSSQPNLVQCFNKLYTQSICYATADVSLALLQNNDFTLIKTITTASIVHFVLRDQKNCLDTILSREDLIKKMEPNQCLFVLQQAIGVTVNDVLFERLCSEQLHILQSVVDNKLLPSLFRHTLRVATQSNDLIGIHKILQILLSVADTESLEETLSSMPTWHLACHRLLLEGQLDALKHPQIPTAQQLGKSLSNGLGLNQMTGRSPVEVPAETNNNNNNI